jgi:hypothetical protein
MQKVRIKYVKSIGSLKCLRHYGGLPLRFSPPSRVASRPGGECEIHTAKKGTVSRVFKVREKSVKRTLKGLDFVGR